MAEFGKTRFDYTDKTTQEFHKEEIVSKNYNLVTDYFELRCQGGAPGGVTDILYINAEAVYDTVGGIVKGDFFFSSGKTFQETMEQMFYPIINPTFINLSLSFSDDADDLYEIGTVPTIDFTAAFNRGAINLDSVFQDYRSGLPNTYYYGGPGLPASVFNTALTDIQTIDAIPIVQGTMSWTCYVRYDQGPQPKNNKGGNYDNPLPAGDTSIQTLTTEGVYPLFATSVLITTMTKQSLVSMLTGNNIEIDLVAETGGSKQSFEIPVAWLSARPLQDIATYNTMSGNWDSTGLSKWVSSDITETVQGSNISYKQYTYTGSDRAVVKIRLIF